MRATFAVRPSGFAPRAAETRPITFGTAGAAIAIGAGRAQFVVGYFAVAVLVEFFERGRGIGDFRFIDDSVMVGIEGGEQGWDRHPSAFAAGASGTARARAAFAAGWPIARGRSVLCVEMKC